MPTDQKVRAWMREQLAKDDLTYLARAEIFAMASQRGLSNPRIAEVADTTPQTVEQSLVLASASHEVKSLVSADKVSPATAIRVIRFCRLNPDHDPLLLLLLTVEAARSEGREKATPKHLPEVMRRSTSLAQKLRPLLPQIDDMLVKHGKRPEKKVRVEISVGALEALKELIKKQNGPRL